jgi:O-antigen ligase
MESVWTRKTIDGVEDTSISMRLEQMRTAMRVIASSPLFGIGPRQFFVQYERYVSAEDWRGWTYTMHSVPLLILCEEGLLGFAAYYGLLVFGAFRAARFAGRRARGEPGLETVAVVAAGALMGFMAYFAYSLTQPGMWEINIYGTLALVEAARRVIVAHFGELAEAPAPAEAAVPGWAPPQPSTQVLFP